MRSRKSQVRKTTTIWHQNLEMGVKIGIQSQNQKSELSTRNGKRYLKSKIKARNQMSKSWNQKSIIENEKKKESGNQERLQKKK